MVLFSLEFPEPAVKGNENKRKPLLFCRLDSYLLLLDSPRLSEERGSKKKISPLFKRDYLGKLLGQALYKYSSLRIIIFRIKFFYG